MSIFISPPPQNSHEATPEIWLETYLSALIRAILYSDDPNYWLDAYRKVDPITTPESELRFLKAAENLFSKGWQVGSDPEIQVATVVSNHLTNAIMKYFGDSGRFSHAANLFEKLITREPEVSSLLAKSYIGLSAFFLPIHLYPYTECASRRGSQSCANHGICDEANTTVVYTITRSMRLPTCEGELPMGPQARETSSQLRTK